MDVLSTGVSVLKGVTAFISELLKKIYQTAKPMAIELVEKLSVAKVNLTFSKLTDEVKIKMQDPTVSKVAVCDVKQLSATHSNVPEWIKLSESGITHMIVTLGHDGQIMSAYFYSDLSNGADNQVKELINKTGEGIVVINN